MRDIKQISSSAESSMIELICKDDRISNTLFFELFATIYYDVQEKMLRFISLREFWGYGVVMKRYLEYPYVQLSQIDRVFKEIYGYLCRKDYVIHFVDLNRECEEMQLVINVSLEERKVFFRSWGMGSEMKECFLTFDEYYKKYVSSDSQHSIMRFDIFQPIKKEKNELRAGLMKRLQKGGISIINLYQCLINGKSIRRNLQVLKEWFFVFEEFTSILCCEGMLKSGTLVSGEERELFIGNKIRNKKRELYCLTKLYNKLLKRLKENLRRV